MLLKRHFPNLQLLKLHGSLIMGSCTYLMSTKPRGVGLMGFSFIVDAIVDNSVPGVG